jgi:hypothetical protein
VDIECVGMMSRNWRTLSRSLIPGQTAVLIIPHRVMCSRYPIAKTVRTGVVRVK